MRINDPYETDPEERSQKAAMIALGGGMLLVLGAAIAVAIFLLN